MNSPLDFVLLKRGEYSVWIYRGLEKTGIVDRIANPDRLFKENGCLVLKNQKKIKVGRIPIDVSGQRRLLYVKRYNAFSARAKLMSMFNHSGAVRSLQGAAILKRAGISTATPVAAVESRRCGMVMKSFYISEEIVDGMTSDRYWQSVAKDSQRFFRADAFLRAWRHSLKCFMIAASTTMILRMPIFWSCLRKRRCRFIFWIWKGFGSMRT